MNGASGIGWDENVPADTESMGLTDDRIRSIKSSVRAGLDDEHNFPSSGGNNVGYHRYGSARPYYGTQSQVSSSGTDGRLMLTSDTSRLFAVGSGGTAFLGGPFVIQAGSTPAFPPTKHYWVEEFGAGITSSSGTTTVTFPNSGYSGVPYVFCTLLNSGSQTSAVYTVSVETAGGATSANIWATDNAGSMVSGVPFFWRSIGTRSW